MQNSPKSLSWKSLKMDHVEKRIAKLEVKVEELDCRIKENKKLIKGLVKRVCRNFGHE